MKVWGIVWSGAAAYLLATGTWAAHESGQAQDKTAAAVDELFADYSPLIYLRDDLVWCGFYRYARFSFFQRTRPLAWPSICSALRKASSNSALPVSA